MDVLDVEEEEKLKTWLFILLPHSKTPSRVVSSLLSLLEERWSGPSMDLLPHVACVASWSAACALSFFLHFLLRRYKYPWWEKTNPLLRAVSWKLNGLQSFLSLVVWLGLERRGELGDGGRRWKRIPEQSGQAALCHWHGVDMLEWYNTYAFVSGR